MAELIGRMCTKLAGREGKRTAVIVDVDQNNFVIIDGEVKRRRCNLKHLELSEKIVKIKKGASTGEVRKALAQEGIQITYEKKQKQPTERPKKQIKKKEQTSKRNNGKRANAGKVPSVSSAESKTQ